MPHISLTTTHRRRFRLLPVAAAAALVAPFALPGGVSALPSTHYAPAAPAGEGGPTAPRTHTDSISDPNFAGYEDTGSYPTVELSASFVVPRLKCSGGDQAIVPDVGSYTSSSRSGKFSSAGLFVGCYLGKAHSWPTLVVNGRATNYPTKSARPLDTIVVKLTESATTAAVSVTDETHRFRVGRDGGGSGTSELYYPWVGTTSWYTRFNFELGVPTVHKLNYSNTLLQGQPLNGGLYTLSRYERYSGSTLQLATTPFGPDNKSFGNVYKHS